MFMLLIAAAAWADCPSRLPSEYEDDEKSSGRVILVVKDTHELGVYDRDALVSECFSVTMGPASQDGPKLARGDMRTPEGWYFVTHRNEKSAYYRSLGISYPSMADVERGIANGTVVYPDVQSVADAYNTGKAPPQSTPLGGDIMIHGNPRRWTNEWTLGCVSLMNADLDKVIALSPPGTAVLILPTLGETESATP